jgi:glycosyltransferase involved in cell wall biosynthesis
MKRLLFVTTSFENGAIPNILLDLAPFWRDQDWDCVFLALEPLPESHASVARCRSLGFELHSLNVGPRSVFGALARLRRAIRELKPDLISTHLGRADIYTPWVKGRIPMVTTHHNIKQHHGRLTNFGYWVSDGRVAERTGVSQTCNASFVAGGFLRTPHTVIFNPVDPGRLVVRRLRAELLSTWGWDEPVRLLVTVARLAAQKGQADLIEAFGRLKDQGMTDLRLVLAGEGPLRGDLEAQIARLNLGEEVRLLGLYPQVADLYAAADAFVLPSLWEGLGLVILEAWCLNCPVAASALPAVKEFVVDGDNGVLFAPGDPAAIATGIRRLLEVPAQARVWASRGRDLTAERFSPQTIATQYADIFKRVLAKSLQP